MAGALIDIKLNGANKLKTRLERLEKAGKTVSTPLKQAVIIGYRDIIQHFQREEGPQAKWAGLKFRKGRILQDTGRLRTSIMFNMSGNTGYIGTNVLYAATHQFGRDNIPARPFLWFTDRAKKSIEKEFLTYVAR